MIQSSLRIPVGLVAVVHWVRPPSRVPHSCPKRPKTGPRSHAGRGSTTTRKPAWLLAFYVDRRGASGCSDWLPTLRVLGSSPIARSREKPVIGAFRLKVDALFHGR